MVEKLGFTIVGSFNNATTAMLELGKLDFDIALLDINMNGNNIGIELGKLISNTYQKPFIFITGSLDQHTATEALQAKPNAYLTKPVNSTSLFVAIQQAIHNFEKKQIATHTQNDILDSVFVKLGNRYKKIKWDEVVALISEKKYTKLMVANDGMDYYIGNTLPKTLQHILPKKIAPFFVQINRAEVINTQFITEIKGNEIITAHQNFEATEGYIKQLKELLKIG